MKLHILIQTLAFFLLFSFGKKLNSQVINSDNLTAFSLIAQSGAESKLDYLTEGPKYQTALTVYNRLIAARGDKRFTPPAFTLVNSEQYGAFLQADNLSIGLEEKAYDICMQKGEAALAAVLGHELSHFYEKHKYQQTMLYNFRDEQLDATINEVALQLNQSKEGKEIMQKLPAAIEQSQAKLVKLANETESDYLGGFLAYSAGYDVFQTLPDFYDQLYQEYGFEDEIFGYASREERKQLAVKSLEKLNDFVDLYEVANLLSILKRYDDARVLYKYILQEYQGREVYNNYGVLTLMEALDYFEPYEKKYRLPMALDLNLGASKNPLGNQTKKALRDSLIIEAITYFDNAISLDPDYAPAYLNKACAFYLLGDDTRADFYATVEAKSRAQKNEEKYGETAKNAEVLMALIKLRNGLILDGKAILENLQATSTLAATNLAIANGRQSSSNSNEGPDWEIEGVTAREITTKSQDINKSKDLRIFQADRLRVWDENSGLKTSKIYRYKPRIGQDRSMVYLMITDPGYPDKTWDGFQVGSSAKDIIDEFDTPNTILATVTGEIWAYESCLLIMDKNQQLRRWVLVSN
jgi:hypothetical protein